MDDPLATIAPYATCFGCIALLGLRLWGRDGDEPPRAVWLLGHLAAFCAAVGGVVWSISFAQGNGWLNLQMPDAWQWDLLAGAIVGVVFYVALAAMFRVRAALARWAIRQPDDEETLALRLYTELALALGIVVILAFNTWAWGLAERHGLQPMFLVGLVALIPFYLSMALPWIRYVRSPSLDLSAAAGVDLTEVKEWLDEVSAKHRLPPFEIRVQTGNLLNALAMGGLFRHLVVLGGGLLAKMPPEEIKGILAHEIAHVIRRDVALRLVPAASLGLIAQVLVILNFVDPLWDDGHPWAAAATVFVCGGLLLGLFPALVSRRAEYGADRLAVELLGDHAPLEAGLRRFAELESTPLDYNPGSHPPMSKRIEAMRRFAAENLPAGAPRD